MYRRGNSRGVGMSQVFLWAAVIFLVVVVISVHSQVVAVGKQVGCTNVSGGLFSSAKCEVRHDP